MRDLQGPLSGGHMKPKKEMAQERREETPHRKSHQLTSYRDEY